MFNSVTNKVLKSAGVPTPSTPVDNPAPVNNATNSLMGGVMSGSANIVGTMSSRGGSIEGKLAGAYRRDWAINSPYLKQLLEDSANATNSTALVDAARKQIQRSAMGTDASINQRQMDRANVHLTPSQRLAMTSMNSQNATMNNTANINTARIGQYENNVNALNRLIAATNAMKKGSASSLNEIAGNESQRRMHADSQKAASRQARFQNVGMAAGLLMGAIAW
ncbi:hypothetical protein K7G91_000915 [Pasteurella canis]|uniref:hypothetical protein n=1 Tax=Pasteurella canis TaxID=753 RepID=UPI000668C70E|nr:hypothetical protein [Pasteurella canis]UDW84628.1 hypothetical protein K7G91_000915 [Pasteurella canis]